MELASDGPRYRTVTRAAKRERKTAAWPAEFAPPTMTTSSSAHASASERAAP
jgi:hypothetical protein